MSAHRPPRTASPLPGAKLGIAIGATLGALCAPCSAAAEDEPRRPSFFDCAEAPLGESEFLSALRLEQMEDLAHDEDAARVVEVRYVCGGHALVEIAAGGDERVHRLHVQDVPPSERARALALAVAELTREVRALVPPPETAPEPKPTPPRDTPPRDTPPRDTPPRDPEELDAAVAPRDEAGTSNEALFGVALRTPLGSNTVLLGAMAGFHGPRWSIRGSALTTRQDAFDARNQLLGSISALLLGAQVGYRLWARDLSPLRFELDLAAGAGLVRLWGKARGDVYARDVYRPYVEAHLDARLHLGPRGSIAPFLEVQGGRSSGIVAHTAGREVLRTGGWIAGGTLGLGF